VAAAVSFLLLDLLPGDFACWQFALVMLLNGIGMGLFTSPDRAGVMNSLPPGQRGAGAGMAQTFQNSGTVLSIGIFFMLIIAGLAGVASCSSAARADRARGARGRCGAGGISAPGLGAVRLAARLQPGAYPARPGARPPAARPGRVSAAGTICARSRSRQAVLVPRMRLFSALRSAAVKVTSTAGSGMRAPGRDYTGVIRSRAGS